MSYCIIIRGPLGVGKTTVAQALAEKLAGHTISIDQILADHDLEESDGEGISVGCFLQANELVLPQIQARLDAGQIVILDGNFYHLEAITHLEQRLTAPVFVFTLQAPLSTCIERDGRRRQTYGIDAATAVYNMVARVDYGINVTSEGLSLAETVEAVARYLPDPARSAPAGQLGAR